MIGLDCGVVLRLFAAQSPERRAVESLLERLGPRGGGFIHPLALATVAAALERLLPGQRPQVADYLDSILHAPEFTIGDAAAAERAIVGYRDGAAAFSDYLLAELNMAAGCDTSVTFDRASAESAGFSRLTG